ncbi:MAG TPA: ORF6N domain-containing protein [Planctomycetota bacterium]|nr:ORF6N domain-containing protein [Planctomycetota bacterium]
MLWLRGERVLLDSDLAQLYGVTAKQLNQAMRRNPERFPPDFVFRLTPDEVAGSSSRSAIPGWGGRRHLPYAFTEQGVAMLSSVLRSPRAVAVNIEVMRAFVRLRRWLSENRELARRLDELERRYDGQFKVVFDAIRALMSAPEHEPVQQRGSEREPARVGFRTPAPPP